MGENTHTHTHQRAQAALQGKQQADNHQLDPAKSLSSSSPSASLIHTLLLSELQPASVMEYTVAWLLKQIAKCCKLSTFTKRLHLFVDANITVQQVNFGVQGRNLKSTTNSVHCCGPRRLQPVQTQVSQSDCTKPALG